MFAEREASSSSIGVVHPRWSCGLEGVVETFLDHLPTDVPVLWFTDDEQATAAGAPPVCDAAGAVAAAAAAGRLETRRPTSLGPGEALTQFHYSQLRLSPAFHASLGASKVLFFESDTVLCGSPTVGFESWLAGAADYVGAPWPADVGWCPGGAPCCCNAGLSLVDVDAFLRLFRANATRSDRAAAAGNVLEAQCDMLYLDLQAKDLLDGFALADPERARGFSVEAVAAPPGVVPFGVHKPWWALAQYPKNLSALAATCPEVARLCPYARDALKNANPRHDSAPFLAEVCDHDAAAIEHHRINGKDQHHFEREH